MFIFLGDFGCRKSIPTPPPISQPKTDNMKTAMQLMVWYLENEGLEESGVYYKAKMLLAKEKEQISKAWDDGDYAYFYNKETGRDFENGEEYYNQIYNHERRV